MGLFVESPLCAVGRLERDAAIRQLRGALTAFLLEDTASLADSRRRGVLLDRALLAVTDSADRGGAWS